MPQKEVIAVNMFVKALVCALLAASAAIAEEVLRKK